MNRKSSIQHALISSIISMLICCTMLVGSTFAWFSDSVSSGKNRISAGNLEVDLLVLKDGEYVSVANGSGDIFAESGNEIIWEPNVTKVVHLAVENSGSLALNTIFYFPYLIRVLATHLIMRLFLRKNLIKVQPNGLKL